MIRLPRVPSGRFIVILLLAFVAGVALTLSFPEFRARRERPLAAPAPAPAAGIAAVTEVRFAQGAALLQSLRTVRPEPAVAPEPAAYPHALRVPLGALVSSADGWYVFVETAPGSYRLRELDVAARDDHYAYVAHGLDADERVVANAVLLLPNEVAIRR